MEANSWAVSGNVSFSSPIFLSFHVAYRVLIDIFFGQLRCEGFVVSTQAHFNLEGTQANESGRYLRQPLIYLSN